MYDRFWNIKNTPTKGWVGCPWNTLLELESFEVPGLVLTARLKCQGGVFPLLSSSVTQQQQRAQRMTWIGTTIKARKHHRCDGTCSSDTHDGNKTEKENWGKCWMKHCWKHTDDSEGRQREMDTWGTHIKRNKDKAFRPVMVCFSSTSSCWKKDTSSRKWQLGSTSSNITC